MLISAFDLFQNYEQVISEFLRNQFYFLFCLEVILNLSKSYENGMKSSHISFTQSFSVLAFYIIMVHLSLQY